MTDVKRRKHIWWEYTGDGVFPTERIKGWVKRYWKRWARRANKRVDDE